MKSKRAVVSIAGVLLFFSIIATFVWFSSPVRMRNPNELTVDEAFNKIENKQIREIAFRQNQADFTDVNNNKYFINVESDAQREQLLTKIKDFNKANARSTIGFSEEPASSGFGWLLLINALPFFVMCGLTLTVIIYAVKTLSRNKG